MIILLSHTLILIHCIYYYFYFIFFYVYFYQQGKLVNNILDLYLLRERDLQYVQQQDTKDSQNTSSTSSSSIVAKSNANKAEVENVDTSGSVKSGDGEGAEVGREVLRGRKGWGDRSVNHLLAAVDRARLLEDYR